MSNSDGITTVFPLPRESRSHRVGLLLVYTQIPALYIQSENTLLHGFV